MPFFFRDVHGIWLGATMAGLCAIGEGSYVPIAYLIELHSTAGLMAGIVYGGDIQSIGTDH